MGALLILYVKKKIKMEKGFFFFVTRANISFQRTAIAVVNYLKFENFTYWEFEILKAFKVKYYFQLLK